MRCRITAGIDLQSTVANATQSGIQSHPPPLYQEKSQNKAGMSLIANDFHFWNLAKAGMSMKKMELFRKAGMLLIGLMLFDKGSTLLRLCH